jgi:predicted AlkP superfamily phosphohydrolase/phosphomutase
MTGRTPGELGIYGFRNRRGGGYDDQVIATSDMVREPRAWEVLSDAGYRSVVIGVPGTYPPRPLRGDLVSCFLAPSVDVEYTWPPELRQEIAATVGRYRLDVEGFRSDDRAGVLDAVHEMTATRFELARHLVRTRDWDFFMMVEMGADRLQHALWAYAHPGHRNYRVDAVLNVALEEYYARLDAEIGSLLAEFDGDTDVVVLSDHGARDMVGGFRINEWLRQAGYLVLRSEPPAPTPVTRADVDWRLTTAWAEGGYYSRVCLNVAGREPLGRVPVAEYEATRARLAEELAAVAGPDGRPLGNRAHRPEDLYPAVRGCAPDLIVYLGDLAWRAIGTLGPDHSLFTTENDGGPDDANHAFEGFLVAAGPGVAVRGEVQGMQLVQMAPTILRRYGVAPPAGLPEPLWAPEPA